MTTHRELAEAFSNHRFAETYDHFAPDIRWVSADGGAPEVGPAAVRLACEQGSDMLAQATMERLRFVVADGGDVVAVDTLTRYTNATGGATVVASCDVYEFTDDRIATITSYAVEQSDG
jgi:ketosteroid isomerase-like protein